MRLAGAAAPVLLTLALALVESPSTAREVAPAAPALGSTVIVGDSTTWRMTGNYDDTVNWFKMRRASRRWHVNAVGSRKAADLDDTILSYLRGVDSRPAVFILALGTNPGTAGTWSKKDYARSLALLPRSTRVVAVTPVRLPHGPVQRRRAGRVAKHATWIRELLAERRHAAIAPWRETVLGTRPQLRPDLLADGVHPRHIYGRRIWMELLVDAVRSVR